MRRIKLNRTRTFGAAVLAVAVIAVIAFPFGEADFRIDEFTEVGRLPGISPDYTGICIPPNIAPLNFTIRERGRRFQVRLSAGGREVVVSSRAPGIRIPMGDWKSLVTGNGGKNLRMDVFVESEGGGWRKFQSIVDPISPDPIDGYLVFRKLQPQFYIKGCMAIEERCTEDFGVRTLLDSRQFPDGGCFNCHSFLNQHGDRFAFQMRHKSRNYLVVSDRGKVSLHLLALERPGSAYLSWHPSGKAIAVAMDMGYKLFNLFSGVVPEETLEFVDTGGDLGVYRIEENRIVTSPEISRPERMETHPAWSPDGKYLYYVSAANVPVEHYRDVMYDLRRIPYDLEADTWGKEETLVPTAESGLSCSFPKPSPDGRFVLFCMTDRSSLSLLREATDLYLMELRGKTWRKLEINSNRTDSYHTWSSNGRWFGFVSKRRDGVHGLVYFCHVDEDGAVSKPFVLPQSDPDFYGSFVYTYNVPEFVREPVDASRIQLGRDASAIDRIIRSK